jgi:hypothetical protein
MGLHKPTTPLKWGQHDLYLSVYVYFSSYIQYNGAVFLFSVFYIRPCTVFGNRDIFSRGLLQQRNSFICHRVVVSSEKFQIIDFFPRGQNY